MYEALRGAPPPMCPVSSGSAALCSGKHCWSPDESSFFTLVAVLGSTFLIMQADDDLETMEVERPTKEGVRE